MMKLWRVEPTSRTSPKLLVMAASQSEAEGMARPIIEAKLRAIEAEMQFYRTKEEFEAHLAKELALKTVLLLEDASGPWVMSLSDAEYSKGIKKGRTRSK